MTALALCLIAVAVLPTFDFVAAIERSLRRADLSHKATAIEWSRELHSPRGPRIGDLLLLPDSFWQEFLPLLAERFGLTMTAPDTHARAVAQILEGASRLVTDAKFPMAAMAFMQERKEKAS